MKISIITATLNRAGKITNCINSIKEQTYPNIEHIVVDGVSKDNTLEILKNQTGIQIKIISEPDNGLYDALNKGIKNATGDVIGFLHSDDIFASPEIIQIIAEKFKDPSIDGVFGNLVFIDSEGDVVREWKSKPFKRKNLNHGWAPPHPTLFLRNKVYFNNGFFDETFKIAGDYDFMLRIMLAKDISLFHIPEILVKMETGGLSNGSLKNHIQKSKEDIKALRKNGFKFPYFILLSKILSKLHQLINPKYILKH